MRQGEKSHFFCMHPPGTQGINLKQPLFTMTTDKHQTEFLPGLVLFFPSPVQSQNIMPQKRRPKEKTSPFHKPEQGTYQHSFFKKLLCCMGKPQCTLNFQLERTIAHTMYRNNQHTNDYRGITPGELMSSYKSKATLLLRN